MIINIVQMSLLNGYSFQLTVLGGEMASDLIYMRVPSRLSWIMQMQGIIIINTSIYSMLLLRT